MKKQVTKKQILKGIGLWVAIIVVAIIGFKVLVQITNPFNVPAKQLEQIRIEEGI